MGYGKALDRLAFWRYNYKDFYCQGYRVPISYGQSLLNEYLDIYLKGYRCLNNFRPAWLGGLELDRYYPELRVAFEFQGEQHFSKGSSQWDRDGHKTYVCKNAGVKLIFVNAADLWSKQIRRKLKGHRVPYHGVPRTHAKLKDIDQRSWEYKQLLSSKHNSRSAKVYSSNLYGKINGSKRRRTPSTTNR